MKLSRLDDGKHVPPTLKPRLLPLILMFMMYFLGMLKTRGDGDPWQVWAGIFLPSAVSQLCILCAGVVGCFNPRVALFLDRWKTIVYTPMSTVFMVLSHIFGGPETSMWWRWAYTREQDASGVITSWGIGCLVVNPGLFGDGPFSTWMYPTTFVGMVGTLGLVESLRHHDEMQSYKGKPLPLLLDTPYYLVVGRFAFFALLLPLAVCKWSELRSRREKLGRTIAHFSERARDIRADADRIAKLQFTPYSALGPNASPAQARRGKIATLLSVKWLDAHLSDLTPDDFDSIAAAALASSPAGSNVAITEGCVQVTISGRSRNDSDNDGVEDAERRAARLREEQQMYDAVVSAIPLNLARHGADGRVAGIVGRTPINQLADPHRGTPGRAPINHFHDIADLDAPTPEITKSTFFASVSGVRVAVEGPDSQPQAVHPQPRVHIRCEGVVDGDVVVALASSGAMFQDEAESEHVVLREIGDLPLPNLGRDASESSVDFPLPNTAPGLVHLRIIRRGLPSRPLLSPVVSDIVPVAVVPCPDLAD
eukprot:CAMPEP_0182900578 /NCGR_PEP_ID=MMETSP0034_2-20130328/28954_1 /TAXON_ID=156128 /ORGANISM="Nephroselmis pyriformis, Strain CCMP717" /LENGTH=537 /DNA_ID=CAMNT_0025034817 /DNA_START=165 /DNA_END=1775 /DNA_ORIENTATION=+